jgi:hypothetical protein
MIFDCEVVAQQANRSEVDLPAFNQREHDRKPASDARRRQAMKRLTLAQAELTHAVLEQRRTPVLCV